MSLTEAASKTLEALELYRERHLVPAYFLTALAGLRDALTLPLRCKNCDAAIRPLHCCAREGCDGCREREVSPPESTRVAGEQVQTEICPVCKDEVPLDSLLSYNNVPNAFCQGCVDSGKV